MEDKPGSPLEKDLLLAQARLAILAGDKQRGRRLLLQLLDQDKHDADAWLWLSCVVASARGRRACLQNVLRINPQNQVAAERLQRLDRRATARQRVSQQQARVQRIHNLAVGVTLVLALLFIGLTLLLGISERLLAQPIALVPLYTPFAVAARPPTPVPTPTSTDTLLTNASTSMPEPMDTTLPGETPTPEEEKMEVEAGGEVEAEDRVKAAGTVGAEVEVEAGDAVDTSAVAPAFAVPVSGEVSVGFSRIHPALDFDAPLGTAVVATADGRVVFAGWNPRGSGNLVVISHASGWESWYAHLDSFSVSAGDWVCRTCPVGTVGNTGFSSGPHLHFEIRQGCSFYNLFTGERLSSGVVASYYYDPFGAPVCLAEATTPPPSGGPTPERSPSADDSIETEGDKGLDEHIFFPP
jgi:murein DD-endopeptidase MepM/ murein hydrolase activator NlpD